MDLYTYLVKFLALEMEINPNLSITEYFKKAYHVMEDKKYKALLSTILFKLQNNSLENVLNSHSNDLPFLLDVLNNRYELSEELYRALANLQNVARGRKETQLYTESMLHAELKSVLNLAGLSDANNLSLIDVNEAFLEAYDNGHISYETMYWKQASDSLRSKIITEFENERAYDGFFNPK